MKNFAVRNMLYLLFPLQLYAPSRYSLQKNEIQVQRTLTITSFAQAEQTTPNGNESTSNLETEIVESICSNSAAPNAYIQQGVISQLISDAPETIAPQRRASTKMKWCFSPERALKIFKNSREHCENLRGTAFIYSRLLRTV